MLIAAKNYFKNFSMYFINFLVSIGLVTYPLQPEFLAFSSSPCMAKEVNANIGISCVFDLRFNSLVAFKPFIPGSWITEHVASTCFCDFKLV